MGKTKSKECEACDVGKYADDSGMTTCNDCLNGTASNSIGSSECLRCGIGSAAPLPGMTECSSCELDEFTTQEGAISCMSCTAYMSAALTDSDQCSSSNTVIIGGVVGAILAVVIVAVIIILIFYNPRRLSKNDGDVELSTPADRADDEEDYQDVKDAALAEPEPNFQVGIPQPPRPNRDGNVESDDKPKPKKTNIVPEKKKRWSSAGSREIRRD